MEDAVVKTIAGFLNTDGGTLLIGVDDSGAVLGLDHDYDRVQPKNGDGFVNWLATYLIDALGHPPVTRVRARIAVHDDKQICRVDVASTASLCSRRPARPNASCSLGSTTPHGRSRLTKLTLTSASGGQRRLNASERYRAGSPQ
jgi:predicted HTH transcriptional regulator